jgi:hypothetical protein
MLADNDNVATIKVWRITPSYLKELVCTHVGLASQPAQLKPHSGPYKKTILVPSAVLSWGAGLATT